MRDFRQSQTGALHMIYTLPRMLLALSLAFLLAYFFYRGFLWGLKLYRLNNSAYKKIKKGETFKEWFLYSRYRDVIPKPLLVFYFSFLALHAAAFLICIILHFCVDAWVLYIVRAVVIFDGAWIVLVGILFWSKEPGFAYDRWIKKRYKKSGKNKPNKR